MAEHATLLRALLREKHWQKYTTFCTEYDRAARSIDPGLVGSWPSRAQLHRWLSADLKGLPYPDHCRVLERMFPPWSVRDLLQLHPAEDAARIAAARRSGPPPGPGSRAAAPARPPAPGTTGGIGNHADLTQVFVTRSDFSSAVPPDALFGSAKTIDAAGLSLNLLCQNFSGLRLQGLIRDGTTVRCAFLDPDGSAIKARELEEGRPPGHLSVLTQLNIQVLLDIRDHLPEQARGRLAVAVYDDTIRFNVVLVDDRVCVVQPYLPRARGVDSPTFFIIRKWEDAGLFPTFAQLFQSQWERSKIL
jgi:hypothetical protein